MVREVASKTSDKAGDGTTTATILAQAIYTSGLRLVEAGHNPMDLKRGIDAAVSAIVKEIKALSTPTKDKAHIAQVGTISANGDKAIGEMLAEAMEKVGKEGVITVEEAKGMDSNLEVVEGMQFDRGYLSPYFVTDPREDDRDVRGRPHPHLGEEGQLDAGHPPGARAGREGRPPARHHRRGHRRRGARDTRREQAPWPPQGRRHQGARLRGSPEGNAQGHRDPHGRPGRQRGPRDQARGGASQGSRQGQARHGRQGQHDDHRRQRRREGDQGALRVDPEAGREHHERLRQGEAPGAPREARGRRRGRQGRRPHGDRDEGEEGPRRGRAPRDPRGGRRRHRSRRRRRAHSRQQGPRHP